jgi:hypothetical protein
MAKWSHCSIPLKTFLVARHSFQSIGRVFVSQVDIKSLTVVTVVMLTRAP